MPASFRFALSAQAEMLLARGYYKWTFNFLVSSHTTAPNHRAHLTLYPSSSDELDIDSPEIREIFLAKIYELSNPSSALGELEDDFKCECQ